MVGPAASFTPGSPPPYHPIGTLALSFVSLLLFPRRYCLAVKRYWLLRPDRDSGSSGEQKTDRGKKGEGERAGARRIEWTRQLAGERPEMVPVLSAPPPSMFDVGSRTSGPPRDESITLNNVNVSPSQHKTNNHCSLPRPMGMASSRGSPDPRSPLPLLVPIPTSPRPSLRILLRLFCLISFLLSFRFEPLASDLGYVASLKSRHPPRGRLWLELRIVGSNDGTRPLFFRYSPTNEFLRPVRSADAL